MRVSSHKGKNAQVSRQAQFKMLMRPWNSSSKKKTLVETLPSKSKLRRAKWPFTSSSARRPRKVVSTAQPDSAVTAKPLRPTQAPIRQIQVQKPPIHPQWLLLKGSSRSEGVRTKTQNSSVKCSKLRPITLAWPAYSRISS